MKSFKRYLEEKLKASDDMGDWVKDFQDSDAPQFKGKSQKERQKMAIAAKLAAERNEEVELDEVSDEMKKKYIKAVADKGGIFRKPRPASLSGIDKKKEKALVKAFKGGSMQQYGKLHDKSEKRAEIATRALKSLKNEEVELDEVSDKKLDAYRQKAFADQPAGNDGSDKYRKRKFGRDLAFAKQTGRAKVLATKEEVELDEAKTDHFIYQKGVPKTKEVVHRGTEKSSKDWIEKNAKLYGHKGKDFVIYKGKYPNVKPSDALDFKYVAEEVELDEVSDLQKAFISSMQSKLKKRSSLRDPNAKTAGEEDKLAKQLAAKAKMKKEEVELDEVSKSTLGRYASKALTLGDIANRMSKSDDDAMGKIANKRLSGVKKAVDKIADKTGKKALARSIKKDVDTTKASGNVFARGSDGVDDQGKSYYKAGRNIGKMREEVELDEAKTDIYHKHMLKALGKSRLPKGHQYTSAIANNGDFVVHDGGGRIAGRIAKGDHNLKD